MTRAGKLVAAGALTRALAVAAACETAVALPTCAAGQGLGTDEEGRLVCRTATTSAVLLPCAADQALTADELTLRCAPLTTNGVSQAALIAREQARIQNVQEAARLIGNGAKRQHGLYLGSTMVKSTGNLQAAVPGAAHGLSGASKACATTFGTDARMCTAYDLYDSIVAGALGDAHPLTTSWVYFPTLTRNARATEPDAGMADNCASYTYPTSDRGWRGVVGEWAPLPSGVNGLVLHGDSDGPCNRVWPIACCR